MQGGKVSSRGVGQPDESIGHGNQLLLALAAWPCCWKHVCASLLQALTLEEYEAKQKQA